ncbi:MAG: AraC family transcriptional regulator [Ekhidna sp.]
MNHFDAHIPPLFGLDRFSQKAETNSFYIEKFKPHLVRHKFVSKPHSHDFYLLLYTTNGGGNHTIDFRDYQVDSNCFFLMTPGQVHSWDLSPETDGFIIFFHREFYQMQLNNNSLIEFPFFDSLNANPVIQLPSLEPSIDFIIREMDEEFKKDIVDLRVLRSYLDVLLLKLAKVYPVKNTEVDTIGSTQKMRKLEQLIDQNFIELKQPNDYAKLLNISPSYLNSLCKKGVGQTLSSLISDRLILEAKRLLTFADLNVNQIADQLKFSSTSYFIRFFKKHVGQNPEKFREYLNRAIQ